MGSCTPQLPIINLLDQTLELGSSKWIEVRNNVRKALEDYGCFEVSYNGVSVELKKSMLEAMEELFELPVEAKKRNVCQKPYTGYSTQNGLSESMGIQDPDVLEKVSEFTQQIRPDCEGNKSISETIQKFSEKVAKVDLMVRRMVMESFGIDKYIDEHLNLTNYRLRLMKYIAPPDVDSNVAAGSNDDVHDGVGINAIVSGTNNVHIDDDADANANVDADANGKVDADANTGDCASVKSNGNVRIDANASANDGVGVTIDNDVNGDDNASVGANVNVGDIAEADVEEKKLGLHSHTDKNLITIVYQHEIEGLEVKTKDGKWIRLKTSPNSFAVMAGDSLHALMNGRIHSPFHRVRVTEKKKTRYSIGLFSTPKKDYIIESPKELVDEKHPRVFRPYTYVDLMSFYHTEAGRRAQSTLHAFCAVSSA